MRIQLIARMCSSVMLILKKNNDAARFAEALTRAIEMSIKPGMQKAITRHAEENFYWSVLVEKLEGRLREG